MLYEEGAGVCCRPSAVLATIVAVVAVLGLHLFATTEARAYSVDQSETRIIAKVTGPGPVNFTAERWAVWGTDLGHMFEHEGRLYMAFGDTLAPSTTSIDPNHLDDFRSNALAYFRSADPASGPVFDGMIEDRPGHAAELFSIEDEPEPSISTIPTAGTSVGGRMYLHFMSIKDWSNWTLTRSGIAYSDDDGHTWTKDDDVVWPGDSNFGMASMVQVGRFVYLFGTPSARVGGVKLARADRDRLTDPRAYRYWTGEKWTNDPQQVAGIVRSSRPAPEGHGSTDGMIVPPNVGEMSVQWNSHYRKWLMMYVREDRGEVIRTANCLTGPWSDEQVVLAAEQYPSSYAPYIAPRWNDGDEIYFAVSIWGANVYVNETLNTPPAPYNVFWARTSLSDVEPAPTEKCVVP